MISEAQLAAYRAMTVEERWREVEALMTFAWRYLQTLPSDELERRLEYDRRQHDEADEIILDHLRRFS